VGQDAKQREAYDVATARAVAPMPTLVEYLLPLVRVGGMVIMKKGKTHQQKLSKAKR